MPNHSRSPVATIVLLGSIGAMWIAVRSDCHDWGFEATCTESLETFGALVLPSVWEGRQWWRVITAAVLHGGWPHLIANAWSLWVVGPWVERIVGPLGMLGIFAAGTIGGGLASLAWAEGILVVGASAGVFGLGMALLLLDRFGGSNAHEVLRDVSLRGLAIALALMLVIGAFVPVIAQAGHVGGALFGALAVLMPLRIAVPRWLRAVFLLGVVVLFGWFAAHPLRQGHAAEIEGLHLLARGEPERAAAAFEEALTLRPDDPSLANAAAYGLAESGVELERAEELVRAALVREPTNPDFLDTLGWVLCRRGRVTEGLAALEEAERHAEDVIPEIELHRAQCAK